jgi:hypothetical protein
MKFCFECPFLATEGFDLLTGYCKMAETEVNIDESECLAIVHAITECELDKVFEQIIIQKEESK